jgi:hypothetical protein
MIHMLLALLVMATTDSATESVCTVRVGSSSGGIELCNAVSISPNHAVSLCIFSRNDSVSVETAMGPMVPDSLIISPDLGIVVITFVDDVFENYIEPSSSIPDLGDRVTIVGQGLTGTISIDGRVREQYPDGSILISAELREGLMGAAVFTQGGAYVGLITGIVSPPRQLTENDVHEYLVLYPTQIWYMWAKLAVMELEYSDYSFGVTARSSISLTSSRSSGIQIVSVADGSRAWECGLRPGDLITSIDGTPVYHPETLRGLLILSEDDTLHATVQRSEYNREILIPSLR